MDSAILNLTQGDKKDIVYEENGISIQLTTTDNQNNNEYYNISTISLGECEDKLKEYYQIEKDLPLLIFKIDVFEEGLLVPKIEYEIYNPLTREKLNLSVCIDIKIDLAIPVSINEDDLYKYDSKSDYYNDVCFTYTSDNGTDVSLQDRKKEFVENNLTLCEENCTFNGYDNKTKKALCSCPVKIKLPLVSEVYFDKDKLYKNFINIKNFLNMNFIKCYHILFSLEGTKNNIGSFILIPIILLQIGSIIFFYLKGYNILNNIINNIVNAKTSQIDEIKTDKNKKRRRQSVNNKSNINYDINGKLKRPNEATSENEQNNTSNNKKNEIEKDIIKDKNRDSKHKRKSLIFKYNRKEKDIKKENRRKSVMIKNNINEMDINKDNFENKRKVEMFNERENKSGNINKEKNLEPIIEEENIFNNDNISPQKEFTSSINNNYEQRRKSRNNTMLDIINEAFNINDYINSPPIKKKKKKQK